MNIHIPSSFNNDRAKQLWLVANWRLSMDDVLSSKEPSLDLLQTLLAKVRVAVRKSGPKGDGTFRISKLAVARNITGVAVEETMRNDVRDNPEKFLFYNEALVTYHPVHLAEMISILLAILLSRGVDGRVQTSERVIPGEIVIGDHKGKAASGKD